MGNNVSVGRMKRNDVVNGKLALKSELENLKSQYYALKSKYKNSDFANSPMFKEKELEILNKIRAIAETESPMEIEWIDGAIEDIRNSVSVSSSYSQQAYYLPFSISLEKSSEDISANIIKDFAEQGGVVDENAKKIVSLYKDYLFSSVDIKLLMRMFVDGDGKITDEALKAIEILSKSNIHPAFARKLLDNSANIKRNENSSLDLNLCQRAADFKLAGFEDADAVKFAEFMNIGFEDEESVKSMISKMSSKNISTDGIIDILSALSVENPDTHLNNISVKAVNLILSLKKVMVKNRNNEVKERNNPINIRNKKNLGLLDFSYLMRNNSGKSVKELRKEYESIISKIEEDVLLSLALNSDDNGEIDINQLRLMFSLSRNGITSYELDSLTDYCLDDDSNIDTKTLNMVLGLKQSGALSKDIIPILEAVERECFEDKTNAKLYNKYIQLYELNKESDDFKNFSMLVDKVKNISEEELSEIAQNTQKDYTQENYDNACSLSSVYIGGEQIVKMLHIMKDNDDMKDLISYLSPMLLYNGNYDEILNLIAPNNNYDENALSTILHIVKREYNSTEFGDTVTMEDIKKENDFIASLKKIIQISKNPNESLMQDGSTGLCIAMTENNYSLDDMKEILKLCKNKNGKFDESFCDLVFFVINKAEKDKVAYFIKSCKNANGSINKNLTDKLYNMVYNNKSDINELFAQLEKKD